MSGYVDLHATSQPSYGLMAALDRPERKASSTYITTLPSFNPTHRSKAGPYSNFDTSTAEKRAYTAELSTQGVKPLNVKTCSHYYADGK